MKEDGRQRRRKERLCDRMEGEGGRAQSGRERGEREEGVVFC